MFITESNISWQSSESSVGIFGALWLADYVGSFLAAGGDAIYYFHYIPMGVHGGCNNSDGTFGMFAVGTDRQITQPLGQFFASQLINLELVEAGCRDAPGFLGFERYSGRRRTYAGNRLPSATAGWQLGTPHH